MVVEKEELIQAVFDANIIINFASLDEAKMQNPAYVVVSYNQNMNNNNWMRKWEIHNIQKPGVGFIKGLWKSESKFSTYSAWRPEPPHYKLIDPKGEIRGFDCRGWSSATEEILKKLNEIFKYSSWSHSDLAIENEGLKKTILNLQSENARLQKAINNASETK